MQINTIYILPYDIILHKAGPPLQDRGRGMLNQSLCRNTRYIEANSNTLMFRFTSSTINSYVMSTAAFSVEAAGQVYNQTNEFVYLGENVNHNTDLSIEVDRRIRNAWCSFRKYTLELYDRPSAPLELKIRMVRAKVLETMMYGCITWSPRACHYDTLRRAHHRFLTSCIGWRKHNRADHPISYLEAFLKRGSESIEATLDRMRILFAGFVARMEDTRLPKCVMFGEMVGGADRVGGQEK